MKTCREWTKECIRQYGYGVDPGLIQQIRDELIKEAENYLADLDKNEDYTI